MDTAKDTPAEQHRMEKEDIEDLGTVTLSRTSSRSWWRCRRTPASRGCWCC